MYSIDSVNIGAWIYDVHMGFMERVNDAFYDGACENVSAAPLNDLRFARTAYHYAFRPGDYI